MQAHLNQPESQRMRALLVGGVLVGVGLLAFALQQARIDVGDWMWGSGWTLFIIVPGLALLAAAALLVGGAAQGLTTAGAIVTTVGSILLWQDQTGHYETWAYIWALIPMAAGLSLVVHGLRVARRELVAVGVRMVAIMGAVLVIGAWYFETVFRTGQAPVDLGEAWPFALVAAGAIVLLWAVLRPTPKEDIQ